MTEGHKCADCEKIVNDNSLRCVDCKKKRIQKQKRDWAQQHPKNVIVEKDNIFVEKEVVVTKTKKDDSLKLDLDHSTLKPINFSISQHSHLKLFITIFEILKATKGIKTYEEAFVDICNFYKVHSANFSFTRPLVIDKTRKFSKIKLNTGTEVDDGN